MVGTGAVAGDHIETGGWRGQAKLSAIELLQVSTSDLTLTLNFSTTYKKRKIRISESRQEKHVTVGKQKNFQSFQATGKIEVLLKSVF